MASLGDEQLAFVGVQGFGAYTTGGRGGDVVKVTTLADSGVGSLRWALEELTGPRIVVFEVGGQIDLSDQIQLNGDVTIAGQTAPGGITITGGRLQVVEDNVVIRGLNIRPGDDPNGQNPGSRDGISIGNGVDGAPVSNVIVDSNSISWSLDEGISLFGTTSNVTLSNNIISEALDQSIHPEGAHGFGLFLDIAATEISIVGNLLAHNQSRNPSIRDNSDNIEFINNVVYNYGNNGLVSDGSINLNIINNLFIPGPDTSKPDAIRLLEGDGQVFMSGNMGALTEDSDLTRLAADFAFVPATTSLLATEDVLDAVLTSVGAQAADRNQIDARVLQTVLDGTGSIIDSQDDVGGYIPHNGAVALPDGDDDGIPDIHEALLGSDPLVADASGDADNNGASNIEDYINSLLGTVPAPRPNAAPIAVVVMPVVDGLNDDADTSSPIKIADLLVIDDALGDNILTLSGADADKFEIVGTALFLAAGTTLEFETQSAFDITVQVDDPTLGEGAFDAASDFTLTILDADGNNAPQDVIVTPILEDLSETTDTTVAIKVADITVVDDAFGENILALSGADASLFEIIGSELFLRAGTVLDFDQQMALDVSVEVDDPLVGDGPFDAATDFSLSITEAPPFPTDPIRIAAEDPDAVLDTFRLESNGQRIGLPANSSGTATYSLNDIPAGTYSVTLGLWDEADGQSQVTVSLITADETQVVEDFVLDDDVTSSNLANNASFRERVLTDTISVTSGSQLQIAAIRDAAEGTRFDYIELTPFAPANLAPSAITITATLTELPEDTDTSAAIKIADIVVTDDGFGINTLSLAGADAALFEIVGTELFLAAGATLDFEIQNSLEIVVQVDDPTVGGAVDAAVPFSLTVTDVDEVVNEAPTAVVLTPALTELPEDTDTSAAIKIADIVVTDDGLGTNTLSLAGADAALFEIVGAELFLAAGAALDFETQSSLEIIVQVDDPTVGGAVDASVPFSLAVTDVDEVVNEAPTDVTLTPVLTELPEDTDTSAAIKIADIAVTDDGLGTNTLSLAGADAALFEIVGDELFLAAGVALDFETQNSLEIGVQVDDPTVGGAVDAAVPFSLAVTDVDEVVNEAPTDVSLTPVLEALPENADTTSPIKIADIAVTDDGLGTNLLSLSGANAESFEVVGNKLFLRAGVSLDFNVQDALNVTVEVDDPLVGDGPFDAATGFTLAILDVTPVPSDPIRIEAEGPIGVLDGFQLDSGGPRISLPNNGTGTATYNLATIPAGTYTVTIGLWDENDGESDLSVSLITPDGAELLDVFLLDDDETSSNRATPSSFRERVVSETITVTADTSLELFGVRDAGERLRIDYIDLTPLGAGNIAPSAVEITAVTPNLPEDTDTSVAIKVAEISVIDDGVGVNALSLAGADADDFEIVGTDLFLRARAVLDFETQDALDVIVRVDDPTVGASVDASADFTLTVTDVVEPVNTPPTAVLLTPVLDTLPEDADTSEAIRIADVAIEDDGLGTNLLSLGGADADSFEIVGDGLFLRAGTVLDFESKTAFDVTVFVDDPLVGDGTFDAAADFSLSVIDVVEPVNEAPKEVVISAVLESLADDVDTFDPIKIADVSIVDDGLGANLLSLAGADASAFEIIGTELFLAAGVSLDFDVQSTFDVTVQVDDPNVGTGPFDASADVSLNITDGGGEPVLQEIVVAVDASADDWEQFRGAGSDDLEFGEDGPRNQFVAVRFDDIDIPAGATLVEAYMRFTAYETNSSNATYTIAIEDTENAAVYSRQNDPSDRSYADTFVWQNIEGWVEGEIYRTPDISNLIDTVVGADGAADAALAFQFTGSGSRAAVTFDNNSAEAPELVLIYESDTLL